MHIGVCYKQEKFLPGTHTIVVEEHGDVRDVELHWHDFYEFEIVMAGTGETSINGKTYPLKRGAFYFLKPSDYHSISYSRPLRIFNLMMTDGLVEKTQLLTSRKAPGFCQLDEDEYRFLVAALRQIQYPGQVFQQELTLHLIECFYIVLLRHAHNEALTAEPNGNAHVKRAVFYIHSRLREDITLAGIAQYLHLNANYFSSLFHRETGQTFQCYLSDARIHYAKKLLKDQSLSISDVCFNSGFRSLSCFLHAFKQKCGCSPTQFRNNNP